MADRGPGKSGNLAEAYEGLLREGHTFVIAEAGVNHNGDVDLAHKLVDAAAECEADAVKFQTFICFGAVSRRLLYRSLPQRRRS